MHSLNIRPTLKFPIFYIQIAGSALFSMISRCSTSKHFQAP